MKKGVVSKIVCSSLALILLSSSVYAAPKKSKKNSDIYKKLEKQKKFSSFLSFLLLNIPSGQSQRYL